MNFAFECKTHGFATNSYRQFRFHMESPTDLHGPGQEFRFNGVWFSYIRRDV